MNKFQYVIVTEDYKVLGTNNLDQAELYAKSEENRVIDTEDGTFLNPEDSKWTLPTEAKELEPEEPRDANEEDDL